MYNFGARSKTVIFKKKISAILSEKYFADKSIQ